MKILVGEGNLTMALEVIHLLQQGGHSVQLATETRIPDVTYEGAFGQLPPIKEPYYTYKENKSKGEKKRQRSEWNRRMK